MMSLKVTSIGMRDLRILNIVSTYSGLIVGGFSGFFAKTFKRLFIISTASFIDISGIFSLMSIEPPMAFTPSASDIHMISPDKNIVTLIPFSYICDLNICNPEINSKTASTYLGCL